MFGFFKDRKRKKLEMIEAAEREHAAQMRSRNQGLIAEQQEFVKKPCAINGMNPCEMECVHFEKGCVSSFADINGVRRYLISHPGCRLWGQ
jgi:hypothetical protein